MNKKCHRASATDLAYETEQAAVMKLLAELVLKAIGVHLCARELIQKLRTHSLHQLMRSGRLVRPKHHATQEGFQLSAEVIANKIQSAGHVRSGVRGLET